MDSASKCDCCRNSYKSILPMPALLEPEPRQGENDKQHDNDDLLDSSSCDNNRSEARNHPDNDDIDSDDDEEVSYSDMPPLDNPPSSSSFFFEDEEEEEDSTDNNSLDSDEIEYYGNKSNFMNFMSKKNAEDALRFCRCPEHGDDDYTYDEENDEEEDDDDENFYAIDKEEDDALSEECYRRNAFAHIFLRPTYLPDSDDDDDEQRNAQNDAFIHGYRSQSTNDEAAITESLRNLGVTRISLQPNYTVDIDNFEDVLRFYQWPDHSDGNYTHDEEDNDDNDENDYELEDEYYRRLAAARVSLRDHQANTGVTALTKDVRERWIQSTMKQVENSNHNLKDSIWKEGGGCGRTNSIDYLEECVMEDLTNTLHSSRHRVLRYKALFQF